MTGGMHGTRHNADLAGTRGDNARAIGANQQRVSFPQHRLDAQHVQHRDAFSDTHNQADTGRSGLEDSIRRKGSRHVNHGGYSAGFGDCILHRIKDRQIQMSLATLARRNTTQQAGAILQRLTRMEGTLCAGKPLANNTGLAVD